MNSNLPVSRRLRRRCRRSNKRRLRLLRPPSVTTRLGSHRRRGGKVSCVVAVPFALGGKSPVQPVTTGPRQRARGPARSTLAESSARSLRAFSVVVRSEHRSAPAVIALPPSPRSCSILCQGSSMQSEH
ncbi:hypothetical protein V5799_022407 [Amblyomma americanum]|uniref:Uncharacterized protein n=1 Tax=Amblyomma americanum TaxID=6943 RepID=A0AAQ4FMM5_AMBAM